MTLLSQSLYLRKPIKPVDQNLDEALKRECGRLIHAAVINKRFRERLLMNPMESIEMGFCGEMFSFSSEERERIKRIQARSLEEFAVQLMQVMEMPVISEMACLGKK